MKKILLPLLFLCLANVSLAQMNQDSIYVVPKTDVPPVIDSEFDSLWHNSPNLKINKVVLGETDDWWDSFANYWFLYDSENLYMFFQVHDDTIHTEHDNYWERDSIELYFDGDNSKNALEEGEDPWAWPPVNYDENDDYLCFVYDSAPTSTVGKFDVSGIEYAYMDTENGWNLEFMLPFAGQPIEAEAGKKIGFEAHLNDNDGGDREAVLKWWADNDEAWHDPSVFGTIMLSSEPPLWSASINLSASSLNKNFTIGGHHDATENFDNWWDTLAPPSPPSGDYYASLVCPDPNFPNLTKDIRHWVSPCSTTTKWTLKIINAQGTETTLEWHPSGFPSEGYFTMSGSGVYLDMRQDSSVTVTGNQDLSITYRLNPTQCQRIPLLPNKLDMVSFNVSAPNDSIAVLCDDASTLLVAQDDAGHFYIPSYGVDTIGEIDAWRGYQLYHTSSDPETLDVCGNPLQPDSLTVSLTNTKLHMIACPYQTPQPITGVFNAISDRVVVVQNDAGEFWIPSYNVNTLGHMQPGRGYQIFVDEPCQFTYPVTMPSASTLAEQSVHKVQESRCTHFNYTETGMPWAVVVTGSPGCLAVGDEIGLYDGDLCVGAGVFDGHFPFVIAAWEGSEKYDIPGFTKGHPITVKRWSQKHDKVIPAQVLFNNVNGSQFGKNPLSVMTIQTDPEAHATPKHFALLQNNPNPFNPSTTIRYGLPEQTHVALKVYDTLGREVVTLVDQDQRAGFHDVVWDGRNAQGLSISSGLYFYVIRCENFAQTRKLIFIK